MKVQPITSGVAAPKAAASKETSDPALKKAAEEFEGIFVRQLLSAMKLDKQGGSGASGYGSMAVDALASGIETGGGLGLARSIEESLRAADHERT